MNETVWLDEVDSTNRYLVHEVVGEDASAVASWNQSAGRGRMGRSWVSPAGKSLALSLLIWPALTPRPLDANWLGTVSALAGEQLADSVSAELGIEVLLKWPNDLEIGGRKLAGVLGEVTEDGHLVLGVGINVWLAADELPTERSTSLFLCGVTDRVAIERIIRGFVDGLHRELSLATGALSVEQVSRINSKLSSRMERVRVEYPDGTAQIGVAQGIDSAGRLLVLMDDSQRIDAVAAGDVWHLRQDSAG